MKSLSKNRVLLLVIALAVMFLFSGIGTYIGMQNYKTSTIVCGTYSTDDGTYQNNISGGSVSICGNSLNANANQSLRVGSTAKIQASPNSGYSFLGFYSNPNFEENSLITTDSTYIFEVTETDPEIYANFAKNYNITFQIPTQNGTVELTKAYPVGTTIEKSQVIELITEELDAETASEYENLSLSLSDPDDTSLTNNITPSTFRVGPTATALSITPQPPEPVGATMYITLDIGEGTSITWNGVPRYEGVYNSLIRLDVSGSLIADCTGTTLNLYDSASVGSGALLYGNTVDVSGYTVTWDGFYGYSGGTKIEGSHFFGTNITDRTFYSRSILTLVSYDITLDNQDATTAGTETIYEQYNTGYYLTNTSGTLSNQMTTSANPITVPTKSGYTFDGYYVCTLDSEGKVSTYDTQYIDASGKLTSSADVKKYTAAGILYAKWSNGTCNINFVDLDKTYPTSAWNGTLSKSGLTWTYSDSTHNATIKGTCNGAGDDYFTNITGQTFTAGKKFFASTELLSGSISNVVSSCFDFEMGSMSYGFLNNGFTQSNFSSMDITSTMATQTEIQFKLWFGSSGMVFNNCSYIIYIGQANSIQSQSKTNGASYGTLPSVTRIGYSFSGWWTEPNGGGTQITSSSTVTGTKTLFAKWTAQTYKITLEDGEATTAGTNEYYQRYDSGLYTTSACTTTISAITKPLRTNYSFGGYYTNSDGSGTQYIDSNGTITATKTTFTAPTTLYAKWTLKNVTVTLNANGGSGGTGSVSATISAAMPTPITKPTRTGYAFAGYWKCTLSGSTITSYDKQYYTSSGASANNWDISSATTLYAQWTANTYNLTFYKNDGVSSTPLAGYPDEITYYSPYPNITSAVLPTRTGYTFDGFYTLSNGGTQIYNYNKEKVNGLYQLTSDLTLYAHWTAIEYTITYNGNSSTGGSTANSTHTYDVAKQLTSNGFTRAYKVTYNYNGSGASNTEATGTYTFNGWYSNKTGGTFGSTSAACTTSIASTSTRITNNYFVKNVVSVASGSATFTAQWTGGAVTLPTPTRTGYNFGGWYSESACTTKIGDAGATYTPSAVITLYAKWTKDTFTLTFKANGGSGEDKTQTATYDSTLTLTANTFSRTGYSFEGWSLANNAENASYEDKKALSASEVNALYNNGDGDILYAVWTANTYTVSFNNQGGSESPVSVTGTYGSTMPSITKPTRTGYTFAGYFTLANGGGTKYYNADASSARTWDIANNTTTLRANWTANTYTVTLNNQGGTPTSSTITATYDSAMPSITKPTRTGYTFGGYFTAVNGGGKQYYNSDVSSANVWKETTASPTLYAKWTTLQYVVTLDNQSATTAGTASVTATYDSAMPSATMPAKTGYTFGGYYTAVNGGGTQYYTNEGVSARTWNIAEATTLYAKWTANTYTVTLNNQSATTAGTASVSATYDSAMPSATMPIRTGYTFGGYYTSFDGNGTQYYTNEGASARIWDKTSDTTLYAKWTALQYVVTLDNQSATTAGTASVTATYGSLMPLATMPTKTGYTFGGYFTAVNGAGTQYYTNTGGSARSWDKTTATTLYAKWTANVYKITLDNQGADNTTTSAYYEKYNTGLYTTNDCTTTISSITKPTKYGYTFNGYYTQENGVGTQCINPSGNITSVNTAFTEDTTLYAKWTANTFTITFNSNGGTGGDATKTATYNSALTIAVPTKANCELWGWAKTNNVMFADFTGINEFDVREINTLYAYYLTNSNSCTLYAVWSETESTTIKVEHWKENINVNEALTTSNCTLAETQTISENIFVGNSYEVAVKTYTGFTSPTAKTYVAEANGDLLVQYFYTRNTYSLTLNLGAGIASVSGNGTYDYDENISINAVKKAVGYEWSATNGWFKNAVSYTVPTKMPAENLTLTAIGTAHRFTIAFNGNGSSGTTASVSATYDSGTTLTTNAFTKTDYKFVGWSLTSSGEIKFTNSQALDATQVNALYPGTNGGTKTLYAVWQEKTPESPSNAPVFSTAVVTLSATNATIYLNGNAQTGTFECAVGTVITITYSATTENYISSSTINGVPFANSKKYIIQGNTTISVVGRTLGDFTYSTDVNSIIITGYNYTEATNLVVPNIIDSKNVTKIDKNAFKNKTSLKSVEIPSTITNIGSKAFDGCSALTEIIIHSTTLSIASNAFGSFYGTSGRTLILDNVAMAQNIVKNSMFATSGNDYGNLLAGVSTLYVTTSVSDANVSSGIKKFYTKQTTSDLSGYNKYISKT